MDIMQEIRTWHTSHSRATLERYFSLGDMMHRAITHTGLTKSKMISLVRKDAGQYAMARSGYGKAMIMAAAFTEGQRATLIDKGVPFNQAFNLATEDFRKRKAALVAKIKDGSIKYPFVPLMAYASQIPAKMRAKAEIQRPSDSANNPDNVMIQMFLRGERNDDGIVDGLSNMIQRLGYEIMNGLYHRAAVRTGNRKAVA